jgi:hypothetical protein
MKNTDKLSKSDNITLSRKDLEKIKSDMFEAGSFWSKKYWMKHLIFTIYITQPKKQYHEQTATEKQHSS